MITATILDQTGDTNGQSLYRLSQIFDLPEFVKESSSEDVFGKDDGMPSGLYADPVGFQFPIHTKAATWLSSVFFTDNYDKINPRHQEFIRGNIEKAASFFSIKPLVDNVFNNLTKQASHPDSDYALVIENQDGTKDRYYRISNSQEVKTAAQYLKKHYTLIPFNERVKIAEKIYLKAEEFGVGLDSESDEYITKQAAMGTCSAEDITKLVDSRRNLLNSYKDDNSKELSKSLKDVNDKVKEQPAMAKSGELLLKLANIIDNIDRQYKFNYNYKELGLESPEDALFHVTVKVAEEFVKDHFVTSTGNLYKIADLNNIPVTAIKDVLGDEFSDLVTSGGVILNPEKLAEEAAILPRSDIALLEKIFNAYNVKPLHKEASCDEPHLFKKSTLVELAKLKK